ncbi:hypothetical protein [Saccharopolyspora rosea]|uniref:Uncharacterized protein n=1 Tax=Saccharopolyspora rosea TaxID=524884 RepID=A0ABW3FX90_9PSEU|nr:hypothetical protein [Saccharopolyspora rosea]
MARDIAREHSMDPAEGESEEVQPKAGTRKDESYDEGAGEKVTPEGAAGEVPTPSSDR